MKIILIKDSRKLGKTGDVVTVKDGYARNCLIPQGIALAANDKNYNRIEEFKRQKAKVVEKQKQEFIELKDKIEKTSITITVEAKDDEELYGSISESQIARALESEGVDIEKSSIKLEAPIKKLGVYNLKLDLFAGVEANLRLWVMKK
ncbi:MAG: 50S ribosomal protein L9 [Candidatus Omnitrophica bacterium]|nr:50S ribosomal protein L9 [Candidatus Omnitrophota bacterium]